MSLDFDSEYASDTAAATYTWTTAGFIAGNVMAGSTVGPDDGYDWLGEVANRLHVSH